MLNGFTKMGCLLTALGAIVGCASEQLTTQECQTIRIRELELMASLQPARSLDPAASDRAIAKCIAGELYTRRDFECIASATTELAMSRCMAQAHEEAGP